MRRLHTVAPVSAVCAAFAAQPSVYQPEARRPDVALPCGSVAEMANAEEETPAGGLQQRAEPQAARQEKSLALFCARTSTSARSAGSFGR